MKSPTLKPAAVKLDDLGIFRQTSIAAREAYQTSGYSVPFDEVDAWLGKLEAGLDAEPPECQN